MTVAELMTALAALSPELSVEVADIEGDPVIAGSPIQETEYPHCPNPTTCTDERPRFTLMGKPSTNRKEHCHARRYVLIGPDYD